jgi:hypothetical protein
MSRKLFLGALVAGILVVGCRKSEGPAEETDVSYIQGAVVTMDSIAEYGESERYALDDGVPHDPEYNEGQWGKVTDPQSPITPLRWGRRIVSASRSVDVQIQGDTVAIATITRVFAGNLIILAIQQSTGDTVQVTKDFVDTLKRKVMFVRIGRFAERRHNWKPVAITLVEGWSPVENFQIDSLEITTPRDTFVVTDPPNTWLRFGRILGEIPRVYPGEPVRIRVTVSSQNDSAEVVMFRWGVGWGDGRRHRKLIPLISETGTTGNYTRVYERTFITHLHRGRFNAFIDALSHGTLFDDQQPYSNKVWGAPYHVPLF